VLAQAVAAPVEKAVMDQAQAIASPVEKAAGELEKVMVGQRRDGEGGRRAIERRNGEGGRRATALGHCGDAARQAPGHHGERRGSVAERDRSGSRPLKLR
jgi:hypothetical protein